MLDQWKNNTLKTLLPLAGLTMLLGCSEVPKQSADTLYYNGAVITVDSERSVAEAVAVVDGEIAAIGEASALLENWQGEQTELVDLNGGALLPGFIDPHSHFFMATALVGKVDLQGPPVGSIQSVEDVQKALLAEAQKRDLQSGEWLMGWGYDENNMIDGVWLDRFSLDSAFPDNPIAIMHVSGHGAILNSQALQIIGIDEESPVPAGGLIGRRDDGRLTGWLMETALYAIYPYMFKSEPEDLPELIAGVQAMYAASGITTAQEGAADIRGVLALHEADSAGQLAMDVVAYPQSHLLAELFEKVPQSELIDYSNHSSPGSAATGSFKVGGCKIVSDGSPQARTALFTTPYLVSGPSGEHDWHGTALMNQEQLNQQFANCYDRDLQTIIHANGDGAIDMAIAGHANYLAAQGEQPLQKDRRTTVIHSQFVRQDQLDSYQQYGMVPALFTQHTYFFADAHIRQRGSEQAAFMSPMKRADEMGLKPTNHTDFMVTPLNQMFLIWTAVNRISREGVVIGADQRISVTEAIAAQTINAAYQYFEEDRKGSIEVGKLADFVILDQNPLEVEPMALRDIRINQTIKAGVPIYSR